MRPRSTLSYFAFSLLALALVTFLSPNARSQQATTGVSDERDRGIQLYQKGDNQGAVASLRAATSKNRDDGDAWHYLGLALVAEGKKDEARNAFERAATIRLNNLTTIAPLRIVNGTEPRPPGDKRVDRYQAAVDSVERYLEVTKNPSEVWPLQLEALRFYRDYYAGSRTDEMIVTTKETTTRLHISSKPPPDFSGVSASGNSVLRAVFSADGTVKHVLLLKRVAADFDLRCIEAARKIKFTPAIKDGRAVSMILQLEYNRYFL